MDLSYAGYTFNTRKSTSSSYINNNEIHIIFTGLASHSGGEFSRSKVYFPVKFSNIINNGNDIFYTEKSGLVGSSQFYRSGNYTKGYVNPLICYTELVEVNLENYIIECGDGFEDYSEYKPISKLSDISEDYRNELINETKKPIVTYTNNYSTGSRLDDLTIVGEYLLIAKNQGTDFEKNNKYIVVYSGTVSNDQDSFNTSNVYFPVEYDGLISLPKDEYMYTYFKGILGKSQLESTSSWRTWSTNGYIDGKEMFKEIVTANRELYTYEVSDGLKEFGE